PVPDVKPVEPVAKKNKPTEWKAASGENWDAATRGNTKLIKRLLADGMDVDVTDKEGLTALYRAAHNDQKETVSLLLSNGANVNIRDKFGNTPLDVTLK
ncbi:MAG: ankyrin repeat domain-containing protein, partial [Verrucomicrobia bacterium]|nr:ankyrin repeat domain-containing protein [Verrucomicrobiota bacterium]